MSWKMKWEAYTAKTPTPTAKPNNHKNNQIHWTFEGKWQQVSSYLNRNLHWHCLNMSHMQPFSSTYSDLIESLICMAVMCSDWRWGDSSLLPLLFPHPLLAPLADWLKLCCVTRILSHSQMRGQVFLSVYTTNSQILDSALTCWRWNTS